MKTLPTSWTFPTKRVENDDQRAACHLQGDKLSQAQVATPALRRPPTPRSDIDVSVFDVPY